MAILFEKDTSMLNSVNNYNNTPLYEAVSRG